MSVQLPDLDLKPCVVPFDAQPFGIVDIGSNTVRLVIYRRLARNPIPIWNEKATCALGKGLEKTGKLSEKGREMALRMIARYARIVEAMHIKDLDLVATAAVRDASDGPDFVAELERMTGLSVTVLSGEEEAQMSAMGVLCALPDADGMVADLGGGSLELIMVQGGSFHQPYISLPLGLLRLSEAAGGDLDRAREIINGATDLLPWIATVKDRCLFAVGGAWRTLARICIQLMDYPLHVLDNFSLTSDEARPVIERIMGMTVEELQKIPGLNDKRLPTLKFAAMVLACLLDRGQPRRLVFSVYGMREGCFFEHLPAPTRLLDPLISSCEALACTASRFPSQARELMTWMSPLFADETPEDTRLRLAACLLGDAFWSEHPDYRAEQAFHRVIKLPFMGLSHVDRAFLALTLRYRYTNDMGDDWYARAQTLLKGKPLERARAVGQAMRLGFTISAGASGILARTSLDVQENNLVLCLPANDPVFLPMLFTKRLSLLAKGLNLKSKIIFQEDP